MKAILLAGGKGTRISRFIQDVPKSTLPILDKPLIRRTVEVFQKRNIPVIVCTGYKQEAIHKALKGLDVKYYHNPFYAVTNSIGTLYFAKDEIDDDCIIMNADVFFDSKILDQLIEDKHDAVLASDTSRTKVGDYFFKTNSNHVIVKYGKEIPLEERTEEYVGLAKVSKKFAPTIKKEITHLVDHGKYDFWWENALYTLADEGYDIQALDFAGYFWCEIDFYDDYERIINFVKEHGDVEK